MTNPQQTIILDWARSLEAFPLLSQDKDALSPLVLQHSIEVWPEQSSRERNKSVWIGEEVKYPVCRLHNLSGKPIVSAQKSSLKLMTTSAKSQDKKINIKSLALPYTNNKSSWGTGVLSKKINYLGMQLNRVQGSLQKKTQNTTQRNPERTQTNGKAFHAPR